MMSRRAVMRMRLLLPLIPLTALMMVGYVNCAKFEALQKGSLSSMCAAKLREKSSAPFDGATICEDAANYECDRRVFRPGVGYGESASRACATISGVADPFCVKIRALT